MISIKSIISRIKPYLRPIYIKLRYSGNKNYCTVCGFNSRMFLPFGDTKRESAMCQNCRSLERHRALITFLRIKTNFFKSQKKVLHFAPEDCFINLFKKQHKNKYLTADLYAPAMLKMDITNIEFPDNSFNIIICNHVLEHIPNDIKAMNEIWRVLKNNGWAVLNVPTSGKENTWEDEKIISKSDRLKFFGHEEHVRYYGKDYKDRLSSIGFDVEVVFPGDFLNSDEIKKQSIIENDPIYFCRVKKI